MHVECRVTGVTGVTQYYKVLNLKDKKDVTPTQDLLCVRCNSAERCNSSRNQGGRRSNHRLSWVDGLGLGSKCRGLPGAQSAAPITLHVLVKRQSYPIQRIAQYA